MSKFLLFFAVANGLLYSANPDDTSGLADYLKILGRERKLAISKQEHELVTALYAKWIDRRILSGITPEHMKRQLQKAGLLHNDEAAEARVLDWSLAGYVEPPVRAKVTANTGIFAISAGVYTGAGCALEDTVLLYDLRTRARLATLNAKPWKDYSYRLSTIDVSPRNGAGERLAASSWIVTNCTSDWNGTLYRIDAIGPRSVKPLFSATPGARNSEGIKSRVRKNMVDFQYVASYRDIEMMEGKMLDRFKITGQRVDRVPPLASTRAAYLSKWLELPSKDLSKFTSSAALSNTGGLDELRKMGTLGWRNAANCGSSWQITVEDYTTHTKRTLVVSGSTAMQWRLAAITADPNYEGCRVIREEDLVNFMTEHSPSGR